MNNLLAQAFYARDALVVARDLIGKLIKRDDVILRITETEAYRWPDDSANHGRFGKTKRVLSMWGPPGHAYVYLCYGIHYMLNFVTNQENEAAAVLVRSCEPILGLDTIKIRRKQKTINPSLLTGPGKIGSALDLDTNLSGHPLFLSGGLEVYDAPNVATLLVGPRVGIDYARPEHRNSLWRFADANSPWISSKKTLSFIA